MFDINDPSPERISKKYNITFVLKLYIYIYIYITTYTRRLISNQLIFISSETNDTQPYVDVIGK